jgi:Fe2+ transport system protein FeoA
MTIPTTTLTWTLDQLLPGQAAIVRQVGGRGSFRQRMSEMGLTAGAEIEMLQTAALGDPIEYRVDGTILALRRAEARVIVVER